MGAAEIVSLIVQVGWPAAQMLIAKAQQGGVVSAADWASLQDMINQSATDRMKLRIVAAGIPLDDPKAIALLGLTT